MSVFFSYVFFFVVYSFFGWITESIYCSFKEKKLSNRGFLTGPFCPIYAVGALAIVLVLGYLPKNFLIIFFFGMLITTAIEYLTGYLLEILFDTKWWDYSDIRFNFQGRICLENSLFFGVMSLLLIFFIQPALVRTVDIIPSIVLQVFAIVFLMYFAIDFTLTVWSVIRLNKRLKKINSIALSIKEKLDTYGYNITSGIIERLDKLFEAKERDDENPVLKSIESLFYRIKNIQLDNKILEVRLIKAFPHMKSKKYPEHLNGIKKQLLNFRHKN